MAVKQLLLRNSQEKFRGRFSDIVLYELDSIVTFTHDNFLASTKRWFSLKDVWVQCASLTDIEVFLESDRIDSPNLPREIDSVPMLRLFSAELMKLGLYSQGRAWIGGRFTTPVWRDVKTFDKHQPQKYREARAYGPTHNLTSFDIDHEWRSE